MLTTERLNYYILHMSWTKSTRASSKMHSRGSQGNWSQDLSWCDVCDTDGTTDQAREICQCSRVGQKWLSMSTECTCAKTHSDFPGSRVTGIVRKVLVCLQNTDAEETGQRIPIKCGELETGIKPTQRRPWSQGMAHEGQRWVEWHDSSSSRWNVTGYGSRELLYIVSLAPRATKSWVLFRNTLITKPTEY